MIVTRIEEYDNKRKKIVIDEHSVFLLYKGEIKKYHIELGKNISESEFELIIETLYKRARERALYLLDNSYKTKRQIIDKLAKGLYPEFVIEHVIKSLIEHDYINDKRYAAIYIDCKASTKSRKQIEQYLISKGISKEDIINAFEESSFSNYESLNALIAKKKNKYDLNDKKDLQKLYNYLLRIGYDYSDVKSAILRYIDDIN